jgi:HK97 family phage major capsid protein
VDTYLLKDGPALLQFITQEMTYGLHVAVEQQVLHGTGTGENLRGINSTSGIQALNYATSQGTTARNGITALEKLGHVPAWFMFNPLDWQAIETSVIAGGQYALNAEGQGNLPVEAATRRLWGVPVITTMAASAGVGHLISSGCVEVATDGRTEQEWFAGVADEWARNQLRLRVESRFDVMVTRPTGVARLDLTPDVHP